MILTTFDGHTAVDLTMFGGYKVTVFLDKIVYITRLEASPCRTRIHFIGDRSNSVDVLETLDEILGMMFENAGSYINDEDDFSIHHFETHCTNTEQ